MALQSQFRRGIGLLAGDAPISQFIEANRLARYSAADVITLNGDLIVAIEKTQLCFAACREMWFKSIHSTYIDSPKRDFHSQQGALRIGRLFRRRLGGRLVLPVDPGADTAVMEFDRDVQARRCGSDTRYQAPG